MIHGQVISGFNIELCFLVLCLGRLDGERWTEVESFPVVTTTPAWHHVATAWQHPSNNMATTYIMERLAPWSCSSTQAYIMAAAYSVATSTHQALGTKQPNLHYMTHGLAVCSVSIIFC